VEKIKRVRYGPLSLDVPPGEFRRLNAEEVEKLRAGSDGSHVSHRTTSEGHSARTSKAFHRKDRKGRKEKR